MERRDKRKGILQIAGILIVGCLIGFLLYGYLSEETIEKGEGTGQVSFQCNGTKYDYSAAFYYDWLDTKFISYLNKILEEQGLEKRLILFGDLNASLITYQKRDFCQRLKERFPMLDATVA